MSHPSFNSTYTYIPGLGLNDQNDVPRASHSTSTPGSGSETEYAKAILDYPKKHADFVLKCRDRTWKVHKIVLSSKSKFFEKACEPQFSEGLLQEMTLSEDNPNAVARLIEWFYEKSYYKESSAGNRASVDMYLHVLADKYLIEELREQTIENLKENLSDALLALNHGNEQLPTLIRAIALGYIVEGPSVIRETLLHGLKHGYLALNEQPEFQQLIKSNLGEGHFAIDIMKLWMETALEKHRRCFYCGVESAQSTVIVKCHRCINGIKPTTSASG